MLKPARRILLSGTLACAAGLSQAAGTAAPAVVRVNGVPFALQLRVIDGEPALLANRLENRWGARLPAPRSPAPSPSGAAAVAPRQVLGRQRGPFHETLSLLPGPRAGTSYALVAVQDLRRKPLPVPRPPLPLPAGVKVVSVVQFGDRADASALFSADCADPPRPLVEGLATAARAAGWQLVILPPSASGAGQAFWAEQGARSLTVVATARGAGSRLQLLGVTGGGEQPW